MSPALPEASRRELLQAGSSQKAWSAVLSRQVDGGPALVGIHDSKGRDGMPCYPAERSQVSQYKELSLNTLGQAVERTLHIS